jgi:hypothetical protein
VASPALRPAPPLGSPTRDPEPLAITIQGRQRVMADKSSFTAAEWQALVEAPMLAGMAVTAADPSGLWGMLKESFATGEALAKVKADAAANPLIKAIVAEYGSAEGRGIARDGLKERLAGSRPAEISAKAVTGLAEASAILEAKAPEDAAAVRAWLASISREVALASKEGGFLGFGGVQVSDAEKATLDQVAAALKLSG